MILKDKKDLYPKFRENAVTIIISLGKEKKSDESFELSIHLGKILYHKE